MLTTSEPLLMATTPMGSPALSAFTRQLRRRLFHLDEEDASRLNYPCHELPGTPPATPRLRLIRGIRGIRAPIDEVSHTLNCHMRLSTVICPCHLAFDFQRILFGRLSA